MTSAQTMRSSTRASWKRVGWTSALLAMVTVTSACQSLYPPKDVSAPFEQTQLWAVAPFANESGLSIVDGTHVADLFARQLQQVRGINSLPVNRVIAAMRGIGMHAVSSPADARTLMNVLGVDGLVIGTVTAYEPYRPLQFGAAVQLFARDTGLQLLDLPQLVRSPSDITSAGMLGTGGPVAEAAGVFDASNHRTLQWLQQYAAGRSEPDSAFGPDQYRVSMELYTEFVCHRLILDLLNAEQNRLQAMALESEHH